MKVSIITATYNSASTISDTILSVRNQTHKNIEHIIVDGGSKDDTLGIIKNLQHNGPSISEQDRGIYDAMNKGIKMATGDIIGILNSDDFYSSENVIAHIVSAFTQSNCDGLYGDLVYVDATDTTKILRKWIAGRFSRKMFLKGWMPPHPTFFVKRQVYAKHGDFNIDLKSSADYELLLRFLYVKKISVQYLSGILVHMRAGGYSNKSINNRIAAHKEDHMAWRINGLTPKWYTLFMKPTRKLKQFIGKKSIEGLTL